LVCGKHYVFGAEAEDDVDPSRPCPALQRDDQVEADVAAKEEADEAAVAALVAKGVKPVRIVYQDGGQNAAFAGRDDVSDPDALAIGPTEIALDPSGKPIPAAVKVVNAAPPAPAAVAAATTVPAAAPPSPFAFVVGVADSGQNMVKKWFGMGAKSPAIPVFEPEQPIPSEVPLPPKRSAALAAPGPQASADVRVAALHAPAKPTPAPDPGPASSTQ